MFHHRGNSPDSSKQILHDGMVPDRSIAQKGRFETAQWTQGQRHCGSILTQSQHWVGTVLVFSSTISGYLEHQRSTYNEVRS